MDNVNIIPEKYDSNMNPQFIYYQSSATEKLSTLTSDFTFIASLFSCFLFVTTYYKTYSKEKNLF